MDFLFCSFPDDLYVKGQEFFQGLQGLLGPVFLDKGEDRVDQNDADDGHAEGGHAFSGMEIGGEERKAGADPEQYGQKMSELSQEPQGEGCPGALPDFVGPVF